MTDRDTSIARIREWQSELEWLDIHQLTLRSLMLSAQVRTDILKRRIEEEKGCLS